MRVLMDTTYAARAPRSGTAVYLHELQRALAELDGVEVKPVLSRLRGGPAGGGGRALSGRRAAPRTTVLVGGAHRPVRAAARGGSQRASPGPLPPSMIDREPLEVLERESAMV